MNAATNTARASDPLSGQSVRVEAVLLTGLFGTGKSTVAAEMADLLEDARLPYAALDLD
jgi:adenylylsulfate kinase-like enzyme